MEINGIDRKKCAIKHPIEEHKKSQLANQLTFKLQVSLYVEIIGKLLFSG
jgi:hypothetical protein